MLYMAFSFSHLTWMTSSSASEDATAAATRSSAGSLDEPNTRMLRTSSAHTSGIWDMVLWLETIHGICIWPLWIMNNLQTTSVRHPRLVGHMAKLGWLGHMAKLGWRTKVVWVVTRRNADNNNEKCLWAQPATGGSSQLASLGQRNLCKSQLSSQFATLGCTWKYDDLLHMACSTPMPNFGRVWTFGQGKKGDFFANCKKMGNFCASCDWFTPRYDVAYVHVHNYYKISIKITLFCN